MTRDRDSQVKQVGRDQMGRLLPGSTANAKGRPRKGQALTDLLEYYMELTVSELGGLDLASLPAKDALAVRQILASLDAEFSEKSVNSRHYTFDRIDGRPAQAVIHSDADAEQAEWLRQIAIAVTMNVYSHVLAEMDSRAAETVAALFAPRR